MQVFDTAPTGQHELDSEDHTDHTNQERICPYYLGHEAGGIDDPLSEMLQFSEGDVRFIKDRPLSYSVSASYPL